jgi:phosphohistidine phosphatase
VAEAGELKAIATSPLVRAVQTAELLAEAFEVDRVVVRRELAPGMASAISLETLARELGPGWALVGHNPSLAELVAHLLGLELGTVRFRKGAVAAIAPGRRGELPWTLGWVGSPGHKRRKSFG